MAIGESRRPSGRRSWKVGSRRKSETGRKAQPEGRPEAQADGWHNGSIGGPAKGASRWLAQRFDRRYRPAVQADGWSNGWAGRSIEGESRREVGRLSWKIDRRRKPERGRKAEQTDAATDESRRLGLKAGPEDRQKAKAGGRLEGRAGRWVEGASWRFIGRHGRWIGRRRRSQVGRKAEPESQSAAQAAGWREGWAGGLFESASRRAAGWLAVGSDADIQSEVTLEGDAGR